MRRFSRLRRLPPPRLAEDLGQSLIIENRGGADGTLAESMIAKSPPDDYTALVSADSPPANARLYRGLIYDFFRDLAPLATLARVPFARSCIRRFPPACSPSSSLEAALARQHYRASSHIENFLGRWKNDPH